MQQEFGNNPEIVKMLQQADALLKEKYPLSQRVIDTNVQIDEITEKMLSEDLDRKTRTKLNKELERLNKLNLTYMVEDNDIVSFYDTNTFTFDMLDLEEIGGILEIENFEDKVMEHPSSCARSASIDVIIESGLNVDKLNDLISAYFATATLVDEVEAVEAEVPDELSHLVGMQNSESLYGVVEAVFADEDTGEVIKIPREIEIVPTNMTKEQLVFLLSVNTNCQQVIDLIKETLDSHLQKMVSEENFEEAQLIKNNLDIYF